MDDKVRGGSESYSNDNRQIQLGAMDIIRKGSWTVEEDTQLANYIHAHGEGRWNSVARCAGLKRTGKSCRLRWLNYLRPNVRRGNITLQEQLLILDLHSRWGNRWSKIAQQLPGRTDNEIKNYWRTRVIKQANHLGCDVNSKQFRDAVRYVWMPRLLERIQASSKYCSAQPTMPNSSVSQIHTATSGFPNSCVSGSQAVSSSDISGPPMESEAIQLPSNSDHNGCCSDTQAPEFMGVDFQSFLEDDLFGCGDWENGWVEDNLLYLTEHQLEGDWRG